MLWGCGANGHTDDHHDEDDDHEHHSEAGIHIDEHKAAEFGIEFDTIAPGPFRNVIKTSCTIESANSDLYTVTAKKSGIVRLAPGIEPGAAVNVGALIATISSEGIEGGDVSLATKANYESAKREYERLKPLYEDNLVTAATFAEAERAFNEAKALLGSKTPASSSSETSGAAGTIVGLSVNSGAFVEVGQPIATVSKNSLMTLKADLPARYASEIATIESANFIPEGKTDIVSLTDLNGKKISGNGVAASSGYIPVYFSFSGNAVSHPGGYAEVFLLGAERPGVVSVPRSALLELQGNKYLYVVTDGDDYEKRLVTTGASDGRRVEILSGVSPGEAFVAKGASIVRMEEVSAVAPPAHSHNH